MQFGIQRNTKLWFLPCCVTALVALAPLASPALAADAYKLSPGDTIEMTVAGIPELKDRTQVNVDGEASLPLVGQLHVAGLEISEVRNKIRAILPTKEFRRHTAEGREYPVILSADEISVRIVEYRPVYLTGDVAKPGAEDYQPGLTIRQAVALAGGYDVMRYRMENPFLQIPDLRSEYIGLWTQFAQEEAHIARIKAELANANELDVGGLEKTPIPGNVASTINRLAAEQLTARQSNLQNEKEYLKQAHAQEEGRIDTLSQLRQKEEEGTNVETADLQRLQSLYDKGTVPVTRIEEVRRLILLSSTRNLETVAQIAQVERERDDVGRRYTRLDEQRRIELLGNLQDANVKLEQIRARLQAASEKLVYTGMVKSQLVNGGGAKPILSIYRQGPKGPTRLDADEDTQLLPGDTVEVALRQPGQTANSSADQTAPQAHGRQSPTVRSE